MNVKKYTRTYTFIFIFMYVPCFAMQPNSKEQGCIDQFYEWLLNMGQSFSYQVSNDKQSEYETFVCMAPSWGGSSPIILKTPKKN